MIPRQVFIAKATKCDADLLKHLRQKSDVLLTFIKLTSTQGLNQNLQKSAIFEIQNALHWKIYHVGD